MEPITACVLADGIARTPIDHYVLWSGRAAGGRDGSLRTRALECVPEVGVVVSLREVLQRAARAGGDTGLRPDLVRDAIRQHQMARPACYLLVRRRSEGDFIAVTRIPWPAGLGRPIVEGERVADERGFLLAGLAAGRLKAIVDTAGPGLASKRYAGEPGLRLPSSRLA